MTEIKPTLPDDSDSEVRGPIHTVQDLRLFGRRLEGAKVKAAEKAKQSSSSPEKPKL